MIKKISLYGLCFNLGVAFAALPTQADLEAFIAAQGDSVKVKRTSFGVPDRITLKTEAAEETWAEFSERYRKRDFSFWNSHVGSEEDEGLAEATLEASEERGAALMEWSFIFRDRTPEERRACFLRYSREATLEELALVAGWGVRGLRIVDFDSIVNGLEREAQKEEARRLMTDETALEEAIIQWASKHYTNSIHKAEIFIHDYLYANTPSEKVRIHIGDFPYRLSPEAVATFRGQLSAALRAMSHYESTRKILVLALVLLKDWKIEACTLPNIDHRSAGLLSLAYDLQEKLYNLLGIYGHYSILGNLGSALERDLFRLGNSPTGAESVRIPSALFQRLFYENYSDSSLDLIEIPQQKFFRAAQMALLWFRLEEIWYRIGFANVDDVIYVNRMADMNLLKNPAIFRGGTQRFTDLKSLFGLDMDLSSYPLVDQFLRSMDLAAETDLRSLCPTLEAWKVWLQLQKREDFGAGYLPMLNKTKAELTAELLSMELIGGK